MNPRAEGGREGPVGDATSWRPVSCLVEPDVRGDLNLREGEGLRLRTQHRQRKLPLTSIPLSFVMQILFRSSTICGLGP